MDSKPNYSPPGWLVTWFDKVKLDEDRARKFEGLRQRLCDATKSSDHTNFPFISNNALWMKALDLLLEQEEILLEELKRIANEQSLDKRISSTQD